MPFNFDIELFDDYLKVTLHGIANRADIIDVFNSISENGVYLHHRRLWDLRDSDIDLSTDELMNLAELSKLKDTEAARGAMLVGEDLTFGLMRMYQVFRQSASTDAQVFRDEAEAVEWLLS